MSIVIPVPDYILYSMFGGTILGIILLGLTFFIIIKTPAMKWLRSMLTKKPLFFMMSSRDGLGGFYVPKKTENQFSLIKGLGVFGMSKDSHIFDKQTKQMIYLADKDFASTLSRNYPELVEKMRELFPKMKDGKDFKKIVNEAIASPNDFKKNPEIQIMKGKTIKISELSQYYPLNITPSFVESYGEIAKRQERRKLDTMKWMVGAGILVMLIGIGGAIALGQINNAKTACNCNFGDAIDTVCKETVPPGLETVKGSKKVIEETGKTDNKQQGAVLT